MNAPWHEIPMNLCAFGMALRDKSVLNILTTTPCIFEFPNHFRLIFNFEVGFVACVKAFDRP